MNYIKNKNLIIIFLIFIIGIISIFITILTNKELLIPSENSLDNRDGVEYHTDSQELVNNAFNNNKEEIEIYDKSGNKKTIIISKTLGNTLYYKPGMYTYGSTKYIPSYEDSIYLSKSLNNEKN